MVRQHGGKGKKKGKDKAKGWGAKGSKAWTDAKPWASASVSAAPARPPPAPGATRTTPPPPTRAVRLLAAAAKEALAEEEEEKAQNEESAQSDELWAAGEAEADEEMGEDEWPAQEDEDEEAIGAIIDDPIERLWQTSHEEQEPEMELKNSAVGAAEEEEAAPAERPVQHGRFISLLGGLGGKRPGSASTACPAKKRPT